MHRAGMFHLVVFPRGPWRRGAGPVAHLTTPPRLSRSLLLQFPRLLGAPKALKSRAISLPALV